MKLKKSNTAIADDSHDKFFGRIHEHADFDDVRWKFANDFLRSLKRNVARTFFVEHQTNRVRAGFGDGGCVGDVCDSADFDFHAHESASKFHF